MYLLINSFFPFVRWKWSLSREPHLLAGIPVSWKRGYHIFSSNDTYSFQGQGKRCPRFQGKPTFSPPIRVGPWHLIFDSNSTTYVNKGYVILTRWLKLHRSVPRMLWKKIAGKDHRKRVQFVTRPYVKHISSFSIPDFKPGIRLKV